MLVPIPARLLSGACRIDPRTAGEDDVGGAAWEECVVMGPQTAYLRLCLERK